MGTQSTLFLWGKPSLNYLPLNLPRRQSRILRFPCLCLLPGGIPFLEFLSIFQISRWGHLVRNRNLCLGRLCAPRGLCVDFQLKDHRTLLELFSWLEELLSGSIHEGLLSDCWVSLGIL